MDHAPLNLAHFHERRSEKFLRHYRYEDAAKALETSLLYLQNAYKFCKIPKSIEVLNTQKWDYQRKLHQIQIRKQQHERVKMKEIVPCSTNSFMLFRPDHSITAQSIAKSIDKTIEDFDAKFSTLNLGKEDINSKLNSGLYGEAKFSESSQKRTDHDVSSLTFDTNNKLIESHISADLDEGPSLAPLELPSFDFNVFSSNVLAENFQK